MILKGVPASPMPSDPLLAIDIGNSRIKLGLFQSAENATALPQILAREAFPLTDPDVLVRLRAWLMKHQRPQTVTIGSVNPPWLANLLNEWPGALPSPRLTAAPPASRLPNRTQFPERVGSDRLFNALATLRLCEEHQPAIIIDSGTATTVDLVDATGAFRGGAIVAGLDLIARALHQRTAQLPLISTSDFSAPPAPVGTDTVTALRSGLFWGLVGSIRELVTRMRKTLETEPTLVLTGGTAPLILPHLQGVRHEPNLTLQGILLAAEPSMGGS